MWGDLSPNEQTAIALRYLEDLNIAEIAQVLGCGESTIRSHLARGLERLRDRLPTVIEEEV